MSNLAIQVDIFEANKELEGHIFELYEKTVNREFKSHVQFIRADTLAEAEDKVAAVDPDYWRTKSVRPIDVEYAWKTFEVIHYSYRMCKSILGLDELLDD